MSDYRVCATPAGLQLIIETMGFSETAGNSKLTINGTAGHFGIKLGGALSDNLVLFGALEEFSALNPSATIR